MIQLLWKPVRQLIKLLNISYNMTQQFHFQVNIPKKIESIRPHRNMYMNVKCPMDTDLQLLAVLPSFWIVPDQSRRFIRGPISHQVRHVITPALLHNTCLQLSQHVHATYLEFQSFLYEILKELKKKKRIKTMNIKMAINSQLSTIESKKQTKQTSRTGTESQILEIIWRVISWEGKRRECRKRCRD